MMEKLTRADALAIAGAVDRAKTDKSRRRLAIEFARDVLSAIQQGRCTDQKFCARLVVKSWRQAGLIR